MILVNRIRRSHRLRRAGWLAGWLEFGSETILAFGEPTLIYYSTAKLMTLTQIMLKRQYFIIFGSILLLINKLFMRKFRVKIRNHEFKRSILLDMLEKYEIVISCTTFKTDNMKQKLANITSLTILTVFLTGCKEYIAFELSRFAFGFIITLIIGVIALIIAATKGGNNKK